MDAIQKEFLQILSDYQGIIHKVNLIYFKSNIDREDNFQEVVFQLWKSFPSLKNKHKPASWIYSVAINTSISKIRKDCKLQFYDSVLDSQPVDQSDSEDKTSKYQELINALSQLNEVDKSVMFLYMEGYNYHKIGEIVGITASNVGVKIHRLKVQLQKQLKIK